MNINPVSFKGTYNIPLETLQPRTNQKLLSRIENEEYNVIFETGSYSDCTSIFLHTPFDEETKVEKLLKRLRIPFISVNPTDALDTQSIKSRITLSEHDKSSGNILTEIDVDKLDRELKKDKSLYVGFKGRNGSGYRYDRFKRYLNTNQPINATSIYLRQDADGEIKTIIKDGRHRFAVLRDMGIEKLPVSISKDSIKLARQIGLI